MKYLVVILCLISSLSTYSQGDIQFLPEEIDGKISLKVKSSSQQAKNIIVIISGPGCNIVPSGNIKVNVLPNETKEIATITSLEGYECDYNVSYKEDKSTASPINKMTNTAMNAVKVNVFVNNNCPKCEEILTALSKANLATVDLNVDMHKPNYDLLLQSFKKVGTAIITDLQYPVVIYHGKIHQNIENIDAFIAGLK